MREVQLQGRAGVVPPVLVVAALHGRVMRAVEWIGRTSLRKSSAQKTKAPCACVVLRSL